MSPINILSLFFIFTSFTNNTPLVRNEKVVFKGQLLRDESEKVKEPWWQMKALLIDNHKVIASAPINAINGTFEINFSRSLHPVVDLAITPIHDNDTLYINTFKVLEMDTIVYAYHPYSFPEK